MGTKRHTITSYCGQRPFMTPLPDHDPVVLRMAAEVACSSRDGIDVTADQGIVLGYILRGRELFRYSNPAETNTRWIQQGGKLVLGRGITGANPPAPNTDRMFRLDLYDISGKPLPEGHRASVELAGKALTRLIVMTNWDNQPLLALGEHLPVYPYPLPRPA